MTKYGRYIHCEVCGWPIYEGDFYKTYDGEVHCENCWKEVLKKYLFDEYIPAHMDELLQEVQEEIEG